MSQVAVNYTNRMARPEEVELHPFALSSQWFPWRFIGSNNELLHIRVLLGDFTRIAAKNHSSA